MRLIISGSTPAQKNNKQIFVNRATGKPFITSNARVKEWQKAAAAELTAQWIGLRVVGYPIGISLVFYYDSLRRKDLDNSTSSVMDALTAAGIIEDDSVAFVDCITAQYGGLDKANPRVEIFIDE